MAEVAERVQDNPLVSNTESSGDVLAAYLLQEKYLPYATDFILQPDAPIWVQINKQWMPHPEFPGPLSLQNFILLLRDAFNACEESPLDLAALEAGQEAVIDKKDFAFHVAASDGRLYRFRGHLAKELRGLELNVRVLQAIPGPLNHLGFPDEMSSHLLRKRSGLIVVGGPTGAGKSTTLSSIIHDYVSLYPNTRLVTLEDPIEYVFQNTDVFKASQRQVGLHVDSWESGILEAKREVASMLMIGELRTSESVRAAIDAVGSGILVLASAHADSIPRVFDFILQHYPADAHELLRRKLSYVMRGVIVQQLVPSNRTRTLFCRPELAYEVFINDEVGANASHIQKGTWSQIDLSKEPNIRWESRLAFLEKNQLIRPEVAEALRWR